MTILTTDNIDNPDFISNAEIILQDRIEKWKPSILGVTKIDNWFDDKWLEFSGQIMPGLSIWKDEVTLPPFHPNRVIDTSFYRRLRQVNDYQKLFNKSTLHIKQRSEENLNRKITSFIDDGLFIWYSSNTKTNDFGSLMAYYVKDNDCFTSYISLSRDKKWNANKTIGLTKKDIDRIVSVSTE